jgi:hypothetical protein
VKSPFLRWFVVASALLLGASLFTPESARAQIDDEAYVSSSDDEGAGYGWGDAEEEDSGPADPLRILTTLTFGSSIRFIQDLEYDQEFVAPAYLDLAGAVVLPGRDLRHAIGVSASLNVTRDGPDPPLGVGAGTQFVVGPSYGLYIPLADFLIYPKLSVPIAVSPEPSLGFELSVGGAYRFLAGFGLYAELAASMFIGGAASIHPLGSGEVGLIIDYEVLP